MARVTHPNVITVYEVGTEGGSCSSRRSCSTAGRSAQWLEQPRRARRDPREVHRRRARARGRARGRARAPRLQARQRAARQGRPRARRRLRPRARARATSARTLAATRAKWRRATRSTPTRRQSPMSPLTRTGAVMGTPMYMAPEQHEGERADARSDQFAFCVALYQALYGDWPFAGKTALALADAVIEAGCEPPPKTADVPARLRKILLRGLATKPSRALSVDGRAARRARAPTADRSQEPAPIVIGGVIVLGAVGRRLACCVRGDAGSRRRRTPRPTLASIRATDRRARHRSGSRPRSSGPARRRDREVRHGRARGARRDADAGRDRTGRGASRARAPRQARGGAQAELAADATKAASRRTAAYVDIATRRRRAARAASLDDAIERSRRCAKALRDGQRRCSPRSVTRSTAMRPPRAAISPARALRTTTGSRSPRRASARAHSTLQLALAAARPRRASIATWRRRRDTAAERSRDARRRRLRGRRRASLLARVHLARRRDTAAGARGSRATSSRRRSRRSRVAIEQRSRRRGPRLSSSEADEDGSGLKRIETARAEADKHGFSGSCSRRGSRASRLLTAASSTGAAGPSAEGAASTTRGARRVRSHRRPRRARTRRRERSRIARYPAGDGRLPAVRFGIIRTTSSECPQARTGQPLDGKYTIGPVLGIGGIAAVYAAEHPVLRREIAVKILHKRFAKDAELGGALRPRGARDRGRSATRRSSAFTTPARPRTAARTSRWIGSRARAVRAAQGARGRSRPSASCRIATGVLDALAALHARGVVHRDLKSQNIYIVPAPNGDQVKLLDLGFAKVEDNLQLTSQGAHARHAALHQPRAVPRSAAPSMRAPICSRSASSCSSCSPASGPTSGRPSAICSPR